jgi:negative regulator of flagellin synthesis FlgM
MKIDPTIPQLSNDPPSDRVTTSSTKSAQAQNSGSSSGTASATGEDTFSLSSTQGEAQTLTANLANVPEVRSQRVAALQQQVNSGAYNPDSSKIADSVIADQSGHKQ